MTVLCDLTIDSCVKNGMLGIEPYDPQHVQAASVDLTLSGEFAVFPVPGMGDAVVDPRKGDVSLERRSRREGEAFRLEPKQFVLGSTIERVRVPANMMAQVWGRSSIGRLGVCVHVTAGYIDPGFEGEITLELANLGPRAVLLYPTMRIAQIAFYWLDAPAFLPYGKGRFSKYQEQAGPTASKLSMDFRDGE